MTRLALAYFFVALWLFLTPSANAQSVAELSLTCRKVGDVTSQAGEPQFIRIDPKQAAVLAEIGLDARASSSGWRKRRSRRR